MLFPCQDVPFSRRTRFLQVRIIESSAASLTLIYQNFAVRNNYMQTGNRIIVVAPISYRHDKRFNNNLEVIFPPNHVSRQFWSNLFPRTIENHNEVP